MSEAASPWAIYRRLRGLATPYRGVLLMALLGLALEGAAAGAFGLLTKPMVDETFVARNQDYGLPFDAESMRRDMRAMLGCMLRCAQPKE